LPLDPIYLATAVEAALAAGRIQRRYFRQHIAIEKKGPVDLVTAADREVEAHVRDLIGARFPSHTVLGEEGATGAASAVSRWRWIVDPIDGTTNFAHGLALFCVSIALEVDGRLELGVVYDPIADELFTAERGEGARLNGVRIAVSAREAIIDGVLCTGFPYVSTDNRAQQVEKFGAFLNRARAVRRLGSAALDLSYVAAGRLDGFWEDQLNPWDIAAGVVLVAEAGGQVTDYQGEPVNLSEGQIVASNGHLHVPMLQVLQPGGTLDSPGDTDGR
jgi:myo-inositol-1(or 4)-monophosphatase